MSGATDPTRQVGTTAETAALAETMLDAGAVLAAGTAVARDDTVDTLTARSYRHPVLGDRVVVRLVPAKLGEAEDLTTGFLSFEPPVRVAEVGLVRQQALGFPAWALVHDPANGHHALALVKEIEKLAQTAKSRIGPAADGFAALGERLARSVPHFLPSFYEEVARAFLAADSPTYAARMFGRARDAERSYGLAVDAERQHAAFLEFALAGALTAKALSAHARDLAARCEPAEAFDRFRRLCVERALGGLPPYSGMHTDLRRLARACRLDQVTGDRMVLADLLGVPDAPAGTETAPAIVEAAPVPPAVLRAPEAFWTAYQASIVAFGADRPAVRGRLLGAVPEHCPDATWLAILAGSGAVTALTAPAGTVPAAAEPPDGPAGWLSRFACERSDRGYWHPAPRLPELLDLAAAMAHRLVADDRPVLLTGNAYFVDLDLLDVCLDAGVPVRVPDGMTSLPVDKWLHDETPGRRDLAALAGSARFRPLLTAGIEEYLGSEHTPERLARLLAVPGLRTGLGHWLDEVVGGATAGTGLRPFAGHLARVVKAATPEGLATNPGAVRRLTGYDVAGLLGRTLRAGVLDEYGWPALEQAAERLAKAPVIKGDTAVQVVPQWPALLLRQGDLVLAVGADRIEAERLAGIPAGQRRWMYRTALRYVDGELLICWDRGADRVGYWTSLPDDVFVAPDEAFRCGAPYRSLPVPGGGRTFGGPPLLVGDQAERQVGSVIGDGTRFWLLRTEDDHRVWHELDPRTWEPGPRGVPEFFAAGGGALVPERCWLLPAPPTVGDGPLGGRDGLVGWRLRTVAGGGETAESVDGRSFTRSGALPDRIGHGGHLIAAFRFPGADTEYGVLRNGDWATLCAEDGFVVGGYHCERPDEPFAAGTPLMPPVAYWAYLRPRDRAGSAALRALTDERAAALLAAALPGGVALDAAGLRALVARELPELTHPGLIAGVAGVLAEAADRVVTLRDLAAVLAGERVFPKPAPVVVVDTDDDLDDDDDDDDIGSVPQQVPPHLADATDVALYAALDPHLRYCIQNGHSAVLAISAAAAALTAPEPPDGRVYHDVDHDWFDALEILPAAAVLALAPETPDDQRAALVTLLATVGGSGLVAPGGRLRRVDLATADGSDAPRAGTLLPVAERRLLVVYAYDEIASALEYAPDGRFGAVPGFTISGERVIDFPPGMARLAALVRERGPVAWSPETAVALSAATGMGRAEAVLLLAGLPAHAQQQRLGLAAGLREAAEHAWSRYDRVEALGSLLPDDPETLWTDGPRLDRIAARRAGWFGRRTPVEDDLVEQAHRVGLHAPISASELLHGLANPTTCPWLLPDDGPAAGGSADRAPATWAGWNSPDQVATALTRALPWLAYHLPPRHPLRATLTTGYRMARARLTGPETTVRIGHVGRRGRARLVSALGATPVAGTPWIEAGAYRLGTGEEEGELQVRPALLPGADDPLLPMVCAAVDYPDGEILAMLRFMLSGSFERTLPGPGPVGGDGGDPRDPSRSAPGLVAEVARACGLSADAATVYLQLLALPDPTDRNVAAWTGWKPARLKAARAELAGAAGGGDGAAGAGRVVTAKRSRAGRSLFLPGGWLALSAPHLPVERWKIPLLTIDEDGTVPLHVVVPLDPVPAVFVRAWQRICDGDIPRFDELDTTEKRR